jgi:hypothetical protein
VPHGEDASFPPGQGGEQRPEKQVVVDAGVTGVGVAEEVDEFGPVGVVAGGARGVQRRQLVGLEAAMVTTTSWTRTLRW